MMDMEMNWINSVIGYHQAFAIGYTLKIGRPRGSVSSEVITLHPIFHS